MSVALAALALIVGLTLLWAGLRKFSWATPLHAALSALDLLALVLALVQLGWLGLALFAGANIVGFLSWGVAGAIHVDAEMASAAAVCGHEKAEMQAVAKALDTDKALTTLGPRRRATLIRLLSQRARTPVEIRQMASPIGALWIIGDRPELAWLVERFDTLLRLYDKHPRDAMEVADTITVSAQRSAATQNETIEALVVAGGGTPTATLAGP